MLFHDVLERRIARDLHDNIIQAIYAIGLPWLAVATGFTPLQAIEKGLLPFVLGDILKLALAAGIFPVGWWLVGRRPAER